MLYRLLADAVLLIHFAFVVFVVAGGFMALRWRRVIWLHLPALAWGVFIELTGRICPLTPLENWLRELGGQRGYDGAFIDHYLLPILYPDGLSRSIQMQLAFGLMAINVVAYFFLWRRWRAKKH